MSSVVIVRHASSHHSGFSGYAQLLKYLKATIITGDNSWVPYRFRRFLTNRLDKSTGIYDSVSLQKETELILKMIFESNGLAHFLNGERDIRYSTKFKHFRKWQLIATFHKPPSELGKVIRDDRYVKSLDGAIAVGANQVDYLANVFGINRVRFIPHGVDTDFFVPDISRREGTTGIFVGYHLRDVSLLKDVMRRIVSHIPDFRLHIVGDHRIKNSGLTSQAGFIFHSNVSNETLRELYQRFLCAHFALA